jgi:hypothetical protein
VPPTTCVQVASDSGASGHYFAIRHASALRNVQPTIRPISVNLPNGHTIQSTHTGELCIAALSPEARVVHLFTDADIAHYPLLSVSQLCHSGNITVTYDQSTVTVRDTTSNAIILAGVRNPRSGLYLIDVDTSPNPQYDSLVTNIAAAAIRNESHAQLTDYYSATLGSPTTSTFLTAVKKNYINFPGLTYDILSRNRPDNIATPKGHLHRIRQGLRSTSTPLRETEVDIFPTVTPPPTRHTEIEPTRVVYTKFIQPSAENYADLAGRFPHVALGGAQYMMIMYAEDANYIHVETMKSRSATEFINAYKRALEFFTSRGHKPHFLRFDNENSAALTKFASDLDNTSIQFAAPGNHRANRAERAIQTWKEHFIATLATTDPEFPMIAWSKLLPQAELTLNLMRGSHLNPAISAWEHLQGAFDFNSTPLAPPGTKILAFDGPDDRASWAPHGEEGFYIGPAMQHYRCYWVFIVKHSTTRISDTLSWHPQNYIMPGASPIEILTAAIADLTKAIDTVATTPAIVSAQRQPLGDLTGSLSSALRTLKTIFQDSTTQQRVPIAQLPTPDPLSQALCQEQRVTAPPTLGVVSQQPTSPSAQPLASEQRVPPPPTPVEQKVAGPTLPTAPVVPVPPVVPTRAPAVPPGFPEIIQAPIIPLVPVPSSLPASLPSLPASLPTRVPRGFLEITPASIRLPSRRSSRRPKRNTHYSNAALCAMSLTDLDSHSVCTDQWTNAYAMTSVDMDPSGRPLTYTRALKGAEHDRWEEAYAVEIDRLVDTGTTTFGRCSELPRDRKASYMNPQVKIKTREGGEVEYRVRGTYGGNISDYVGPKSADVAHMTTIKLFLNATVSKGAFWMTADIKDYYLGTPMSRKEYMRVPLSQLPESVIAKYNLRSLAENGMVLILVHKGIYGLPQAGRLAQDRLVAHLAKYGYAPTPDTPALFKHATRPISFVLVVDDFGIQYASKADADHLVGALRDLYTLKVDWTGKKYVGFDIDYNMPEKYIDLSMHTFIPNAIKRFGVPTQGINSPGTYVPFHCSKEPQLVALDTTPLVSEHRAKRIQEIVGVLQYYATAVDATLVTRVHKVGSLQSRPTVAVEQAAERLLQYVYQWPAATIRYHASDMRLIVHSDASYLSEPQARSRVGGITYCGNYADDTIINGGVKCTSKILDCVVSGAAEAEYGGLFLNGKEAASQRTTLKDMDFPQRCPTLIVCDNLCAVGITNSTVKQRRSKAWDMRFHWIRDRVRQDQLDVVWRKGSVNLADYFTKDHPTKHFMSMRPFYVYTPPRDPTDNARSRRISLRIQRDGLRPTSNPLPRTRLSTNDLPDPKKPRPQ